MSENKNASGSDMVKVDASVLVSDDYDEIPELGDAFFSEATLHLVGKPIAGPGALAVPLALDRDVVERLRATGPGWQKRINEILRNAVGLSSPG